MPSYRINFTSFSLLPSSCLSYQEKEQNDVILICNIYADTLFSYFLHEKGLYILTKYSGMKGKQLNTGTAEIQNFRGPQVINLKRLERLSNSHPSDFEKTWEKRGGQASVPSLSISHVIFLGNRFCLM